MLRYRATQAARQRPRSTGNTRATKASEDFGGGRTTGGYVELAALKARVEREVDQQADLLIRISQEIHAHPELCFQESRALDLLTAPLASAGLSVQKGVAGLDTAF